MIKKVIVFSILLLSPIAANAANSETFKIDRKNSIVEFVVFRGKHIGARGSFTNVGGTVNFNKKYPRKSSVSATIPIKTLDTSVAVRDTDLKGKKYFDCQAFPEARFVSSRYVVTKSGRAVVSGTFHLHGVSKQVSIKLKKQPILITKKGKKVIQVVGETTVDQADYGLSLLELHPDGAVRINKGIKITVKIEAYKP